MQYTTLAKRTSAVRCGLAIILLTLLLGIALPSNARVLKRGMRGNDVASLQVLLLDLGYKVVVDGVFGPKTESLVKAIQQSMGLRVDGLVGQQTITVLNQLRQGVVRYTVQSGDNLTRLAQLYDTTVSNIIKYNDLANPDSIRPGQVLHIPTTSLAVLSRFFANQPKFFWPVQGRMSSGYGYRIHPVTKVRHFHGGIDIAVPQGTQVRASAAGRVVRAGAMGNYGLGVVIDHGGGYTTWYGHNSQILVRVGDVVQQGQAIALSGRTGLATGPHLDFRIKIGDQTIDPLELLF
mgnify:FL=1